MINILQKLLQSDNNAIREGTKELREALKKPEAVPELCTALATASDPQIRQYAAVVLRKRLTNVKHWCILRDDIRNTVKNILMQTLVSEQEKIVKNSIVHLIGVIVKHDVPSSYWPELMQFFQHTTTSSDTNEKELGFYTLSILTDTAKGQFYVHTGSFVVLFSNTLANLSDPASPVAYFIILCMINLGSMVSTNKELTNIFIEMIPRILVSIRAMSTKRPDRALEAMDFLFFLSGEDGKMMLGPKIKPIVKMCLEFAENKSLSEELQIKALNFVAEVVDVKTKLMEKNHLLEPTLGVLFRIMSSQPEDEDHEEYFSITDEDTILTCACETLDTIALHMKPESIIPPLMNLMEPALQGENIYPKKAAYLCLGILAQGCEEHIRTTSLSQFVQVVYKGIVDPHNVIRNAALFAMGQFAEFLQPEICQYSQELMPVLIALLDQLMEKAKQPSKIGNAADRIFYAIEKFSENLEDSLVMYLPELINKLLTLTRPEYNLHVRELAIGAIGTTAEAVKEALSPYFHQIMGILNGFLMQKEDAVTCSLQVAAIDSLAMIAKNIGEGHFNSALAKESIQFGLRMLQTTEDPDLKKSTYGLIASVSSILKEEMAPVLPTIIEFIIQSVKSEDGFSSPVKEDESGLFVYDSESEEDIEEITEEGDHEESNNDLEDYSAFNVENDFIEEKEESCYALKELAANTGEAFIPYLQASFTEVFKLLNFPHEDVRRAAVETEFQLCLNIAKIHSPEGDSAFTEALDKLVAKAALLVRIDEDRDVVLTVLDCFQNMLKEIGSKVILNKTVCNAIIACIKDILKSGTEVQGYGEDQPGCQDHPDEDLIDAASDLIPALGKAMTSQEFAAHFATFLPLYKNRLYSTSSDDSPKANSIGMLAECMQPLGEYIALHLNTLLPYLLCLTKDKSINVRNNAIFALGEMACHGKEAIYPHYPEILNALSGVLPTEKSGKVLDNICGAIARLIIANTSGVPIEQVLPVLVSQLPLKEDYDENKWVFGCITHLYSLGNQVLVQQLVPVIKTAVLTLHTQSVDDETKELLLNFVKMCSRDFPEDCQRAASQLPPETVTALQQV